jgi:IclR family transcriptional regulator, KDG regulon repressor
VTEVTRVATRREIRPVQALSHAIDVLEALARSGEMGVSEISREIGLSKTAVYNILGTFEGRRMINRDPITSRYRLGWRLYELGAELLRHNELGPLARPLLKELAQRTGETVLFGILDRAGVTYVDRVESERSIRMVAAPGRQAALHATASGKALLAHQPPETIDAILAGELHRFTPETITDPDELRADLRRVVERGYAECIREHEPEICSISVPVRNYSGNVAAALTVAAPATRFAETERRVALAVLQEIARELSVQLGAREDELREIA